MECMFCKGSMSLSGAPLDVQRDGYHLHFNNLPAWVCSQCGEPYFDTDTVVKIENVASKIEAELSSFRENKLNDVA